MLGRRLAACRACLNQQNSPLPRVQIRAVIVDTCVFLVSQINGDIRGTDMAEQGETCYQDCFNMHIGRCRVDSSWASTELRTPQ